jgi:predicted house-cleaning noncanonical NTP pyrophosphatase (MazG superfamily)
VSAAGSPEPYFVKLVRDDVARHVPDAAVTFGPVPAEKMHDLLKGKLVEEVGEYLVNPSLSELADVLEVVHALADRLGHTWGELQSAAEEKFYQRGGFYRGTGMFCTTTPEAERLNSHALKDPSKCGPSDRAGTESAQRSPNPRRHP